jgi:hypothetical protein
LGNKFLTRGLFPKEFWRLFWHQIFLELEEILPLRSRTWNLETELKKTSEKITHILIARFLLLAEIPKYESFAKKSFMPDMTPHIKAPMGLKQYRGAINKFML